MYSKLILLLACFHFTVASAQDLNFSQFHELPLLRNPALAGIYNGDFRATSAIRSQWGSVTVPYTSQALSFEMKTGISESSDDYFSFGMQLARDMAGDSKFGKTQFLPMIAYHKSMSSQRSAYLTMSFMGGLVQQRFDPTQLRFDDEFSNGVYTPNSTSQMFTRTQLNYIDAAVGLSFSSETDKGIKYYVGAALFHFTKPKVAFYKQDEIKLNQKIIGNVGLSLPMSETDNLIMYIDYFKQGGHSLGQGGLLYRKELWSDGDTWGVSLTGGALMRWNDAIIPVVRLDYNKIGVGLSYDANLSKLKSASQLRGGYELTLSYKTHLNINNSTLEKMKCPVAL